MTRTIEQRPGTTGTAASGFRRAAVPLIALCCGVTVANIYLAQPLLPLIVRDLDISTGAASRVPTFAQLGYALGLLLLVPLGDVTNRRKLLATLIGLTAVALLAVAAAPNLAVLLIATLLASALTVIPQLFLPLAAELAPQQRRGSVLAAVMVGLIIGIFGARVIGGQLGGLVGWRAVYVVAAALTLVTGAIALTRVPADPSTSRVRYGRLLASLPSLLHEPALRQACMFQMLVFATFQLFWTTLVYLLTSPPYGFGVAAAGLFGLFGLVSAAAAPFVGRMIDRYGAMPVIGSCLVTVIAAAVAFTFGQVALGTVVAGIALLSLGMQGAQVANQTRFFTARAQNRSGMNTVYMVGNFIAGSLAAALSGALYSHWGWSAVSAAGIVISTVALTSWATVTVRERTQI